MRPQILLITIAYYPQIWESNAQIPVETIKVVKAAFPNENISINSFGVLCSPHSTHSLPGLFFRTGPDLS